MKERKYTYFQLKSKWLEKPIQLNRLVKIIYNHLKITSDAKIEFFELGGDNILKNEFTLRITYYEPKN